MTYKKAMELSLNVVIIAAIGLMVLVIMAFIFRGESAKFVKSTDCTARGGVCLEGNKDCPDEKPIKVYTNDCPEVSYNQEKGMFIAKEGRRGPGQCCLALS